MACQTVAQKDTIGVLAILLNKLLGIKVTSNIINRYLNIISSYVNVFNFGLFILGRFMWVVALINIIKEAVHQACFTNCYLAKHLNNHALF